MSDIVGQVLDWQVEEVIPSGYWLVLDSNTDQKTQQERVFLPQENAVAALNEGDVVAVIVTHDEQNNPIADGYLPKSKINTPVTLLAKDVTARGAYFDWGMTRDLYVPAKWQEQPINAGMTYVVHTFVDPKSGRITGATKLHRFYPETSEWLKEGQDVSLTVFAKTQLGYKVLIDESVLGLLFHSDVSVNLKIGTVIDGVIKARRDDGKLNVALRGESKQARRSLQQQILDDLHAHDGISTLTDKSSPEEILEKFAVSKGAYKKAIGNLFKNKKILIERSHIKLCK